MRENDRRREPVVIRRLLSPRPPRDARKRQLHPFKAALPHSKSAWHVIPRAVEKESKFQRPGCSAGALRMRQRSGGEGSSRSLTFPHRPPLPYLLKHAPRLGDQDDPPPSLVLFASTAQIRSQAESPSRLRCRPVFSGSWYHASSQRLTSHFCNPMATIAPTRPPQASAVQSHTSPPLRPGV